MKKTVSQLTDTERAKLFPILLEKHNTKWKQWYHEEKQVILKNIIGISSIHHYGSTSIPNIIAKPTIDILAEIERSTDLNNMRTSFINMEYDYMAFGKEPSIMFVKGYTLNGFAERVFHVHVYYKGLQEELLFRDYLIKHAEIAKEYERLKLSLKEEYEFDRDGYTHAKHEFIRKTTDKALNEYAKAKT